MYALHTVMDTVRVPPADFGGDLKKSVLAVVRREYEGILDEDLGLVVTVIEVSDIGQGRIVPGDGAAYYAARLKLLTYKPEVQEVVEGVVSEITEFGAFLKTGPIEGLIHVSQIMDDYINYDDKLPGFTGKETSKKLKLGDTVLARIVSVSLKDSVSNSKIGLTMRQLGLGKDDWMKVDEATAKKKEESEEARKKKVEKAKEKAKEGRK